MRQLTDHADHGVLDRAPAWSPDGSQIAFSFGSDIYVMDADGSGQAQKLTSEMTDEGDNSETTDEGDDPEMTGEGDGSETTEEGDDAETTDEGDDAETTGEGVLY